MCITVTCCILISIRCSRLWTCRHFIILGKSNCFTKIHVIVFDWLTSFGYLEWRGLHTCAEGLLLYQGMQKFNNIPYKSLISFHSKVCKLLPYTSVWWCIEASKPLSCCSSRGREDFWWIPGPFFCLQVWKFEAMWNSW